MKSRILFSTLALCLFSGLTLAYNTQGLFEFTAPVVDDHDNTTVTDLSEVGTIVYDNTDSQFFGRDSSGTWQALSSGGNLNLKITYLKDIKTSGTAGGTFTSGAWQTRALNTIEGDNSIVTLSSNQFTLNAGSYDIEVEAPAYLTGAHKAKVRNITDSSDELIGTSAAMGTGTGTSTISLIKGLIAITSQKTFEIQHQSAITQSTNGFGYPSNFGVNEVYTQVKIIKLN